MNNSATVTPQLDPFSEQFTIYPETQLGPLRAQDPVHFLEMLGCWLLTRHADVKRACSDPALTQDMEYWQGYQPPAEPDPYPTLTWSQQNSPFKTKHTILRRLLAQTFTPRAIRRIETLVEDVVSECAKTLDQGGTVDVASDFVKPIPNTVISRIIGIPAMGAEEANFRDNAIIYIRSTNPLASPEEKAECEIAAAYLRKLLQQMIKQRKQQPQEDLISDLLAVAQEEASITEDDIIITIMLLISAGSDTASQGANMAIRNLLRHPDQLEKLQRHPEHMDNAIKELLRYDTVGKFVPRFAKQDVYFGDKLIKKGQAVFMSMQGANWDPEVFDTPSILDIERDTSKTLSFGHGPHFCVGAHLAKTEITCVLQELLKRTNNSTRLEQEGIVWDCSNMVFRNIEKMPITFA